MTTPVVTLTINAHEAKCNDAKSTAGYWSMAARQALNSIYV